MSTAAPIHLAGERLMLDPSGVVFWPPEAVLVVSDLHLEKGSSFARRGMLLPPWDTKATLDLLAAMLRRFRPRTVIALGDSFHDTHGAARLDRAEVARLEAMTKAAAFVWIAGNHDPSPPASLGGRFADEVALGPFVFRHQASARGAEGELSGHHHPKAAVPARGCAVTRPCFVADARRLILPAFGAYTGGLDVTHPAIARLFPRGGRLFLLGRDRLFSFPLSEARRAPVTDPASPADP